MAGSTPTLYNDDLACFALYYGDEYFDQYLVLYNATIDSMMTPYISGHSGHFLGPGVFYDDGSSFVVPSWNVTCAFVG